MTARLHPTIVSGDDWTFIRLAGVLAAESMPADLSKRAQGSLIFVDLSGIERVDPAGINEWTQWLAAVSSDRGAVERDIVLINCSIPVVGEMRQFPSFTAGASVMSVSAPYYCETCDAERPSALVLPRLTDPPTAPDQRCKVCGNETTFDDIEATWFAFLGSVTRAKPTARIEHALISARFELGEGPAPVAPPRPSVGAETERVDHLLAEIAESPKASNWDMGFWLAVGVLLAVFTLVILQLVTQ